MSARIRVSTLAELDSLVGEHITGGQPEVHWEDSHGSFQFATEAEAKGALNDPYYQNFLPDVDWAATTVREVKIHRPYTTDMAVFWQFTAAATEQLGPLKVWRDRGQWLAVFGTNREARAHTAQVAVCLAALAAKDIELELDHARLDRQLAALAAAEGAERVSLET